MIDIKVYFVIIYMGFVIFTISCETDRIHEEIDYRSEMRQFVEDISLYGKSVHPGFFIIPQNGQELLTYNGDASGEPVLSYLNAIDGVGREDLFYGYVGDDKATPIKERNYMLPFLALAEREGIEVLTIDYCSTESKMDQSYRANNQKGFISFSADHRALDTIPVYPPVPFNWNNRNIRSLSEASNFLYLINPGFFSSHQKMLEAISETNYDLLIIDLFDNNGEKLTADELKILKQKSNGSSRLVIAYMSIGEAEDYRYYWQRQWNHKPPVWLDRENPQWEGNFKVRYWEPSWQKIILGDNESYFDMILQTGFDGVYLDIIDAFEYFE